MNYAHEVMNMRMLPSCITKTERENVFVCCVRKKVTDKIGQKYHKFHQSDA